MRAEIRKELEALATTLHDSESVVAGSQREREIVEKVRGLAEEALGSSRLSSVPLLAWELRGAEMFPKPKSLAIAPYVERASLEAPWVRMEERASREGKIVVAREPEDPDDIKYLALEAARDGAVGLIVESPSSPRAIVTTGHWGFSYYVGSPPPIPIVVVEEGYSSRAGNRISMNIETRTKESRGYIVEAGTLDKADALVLVGAHHDKWYSGFNDNTIGLAQAIITAKHLMEKGVASRFVSFTAEEYGAPGYASWYWAWGSRVYAEGLAELEAYQGTVYVNYDMAAVGELTFSGSPHYSIGSRERCCECPECDSFSFASQGFQTLSLHGLWGEEVKRIYHTPMDLPETSNMESAAEAVELTIRSISTGPRWGIWENFIASVLGKAPLEARVILSSIDSIAKRTGWEHLYPLLARSFLKAVHFGSYFEESRRLEALWFPEIVAYVRLRAELERGRAPSEVWVAGEERLLYAIGRGNKVSLDHQLKVSLRRLREEVESIGRELLK
ncbi:MAG: M28 family peptidase [Acidilobaceae archaeon]|nr:M28 family peptidase [Acidilobaceae archaeon]MCX8165543.1 M28 family peptidase [Acidilobaceae archaeon]MDW7973970.1 M28 family peptidase [Sulfolobales archaeon]